MSYYSNKARMSAGVGALIWLPFLLIRTSDSSETELLQKILLLGVLVVVPLGLSLIPAQQDSDESLLYRLAVPAQPVAAVAVTVSFLFSPGAPAAILVASWLLVSLVLALEGLKRLLSRSALLSSELSIDAGLAYLVVGAVGLLASRLGIQPMGFGDTIVLLTAVHFHFAGFAAPLLAGLAGRYVIQGSRQRKILGLAIGFIVGGTPLVAAGITFSDVLGLVGTLVIATGLLLLAILVLGWVVTSQNTILARTLLAISSLSSVFAMILASLYAYSLVVGTVILDIPQMALSHGLLNSFGFTMCGLLGWWLVNLEHKQVQK